MKLISWNVNGLRACVSKGFVEWAGKSGADIIAVQEVKGSADNIDIQIDGYRSIYSFAERRGYSGTGIFYKKEPLRTIIGLEDDEFNHEGRVITLEYPDFYFITAYVPNAQEELKRIDFRLGFDAAFRKHIAALMKTKGVIVTGDLNVARKPIDLRNPDANEGHAGYSAQERESFEKLLSLGLVDTFRHFYPDKTDAYSWWSYRFHAREKNIGWRIDYFLISEDMLPFLEDAGIMGDVTGSDHAPIFIDIAK